jgi:hypothetical protein
MLAHRAAAVAALVLLFTGLPGRAQFAYNTSARPAAIVSPDPDPEETPKAAAYKTVRGVVQGQQGALPGATVWLHGSRTIVATNAEGEFELRVPAEAKIIELTCGYAGLQDETVRLPPVQALGSVYLLRPHVIK